MDLLAQTSTGPVEGRVKEGVLLFAGIPFAEAPVGRLRFAPPAPHPGWREPLAALRPGDARLDGVWRRGRGPERPVPEQPCCLGSGPLIDRVRPDSGPMPA